MFPATAARTMGLGAVPLMCARELAVVGSTPRCVRVMLHVATERARARTSTTSTSRAPRGSVTTSPTEGSPPRSRRARAGHSHRYRPHRRFGGDGPAARGWHVTGSDATPGTAARAVALGALDAEGEDRDADLVLVATPVAAAADVVTGVLDGRAGTRTRSSPTSAASRAPGGGRRPPRFVGGHPMAGCEQVGVEGAGRTLRRGHVGADPDAVHRPDAYARLGPW